MLGKNKIYLCFIWHVGVSHLYVSFVENQGLIYKTDIKIDNSNVNQKKKKIVHTRALTSILTKYQYTYQVSVY